MWKGKGRSGYGESSTLGDYDDWSCLSRNGKQWKNPITMETRDLSGADYWHMRKQLTDSYDVPESLHAVNETVSLAHTLPNGKANLLAYADRAPVRKSVSKVSIKDKILPQFKRLTTLRDQMLELETSYKSGEMSIADYSLLRDLIVAKIQRQEVLLKRATSVKPINNDEDDLELYEDSPEVEQVFYATNHASTACNAPHTSTWVDDLPDSNSLKPLCSFVYKIVVVLIKLKNYLNKVIKENG